ncbi:PapI protein [Escherichia coli O10:K5(L):H4 str. ATCC 23506]|nr:PapI protein [Escherichia coli O10:K5(L):H4 str. ATCC 23506]
MKNEILEFLNRHNGGKTAEIAEALAVTDYQARYYLLLLEKEGVVQRSPLRRGIEPPRESWRLNFLRKR